MNGFISYAHTDYKMFEEFLIHLAAIERAYEISFWSDKRIHAGYQWEKEILNHIRSADVILALVSPGFIKSDYIWDKELPAIKARRTAEAGVLVIAVVLKPCQWDLISASRQVVPTQNRAAKPIDTWRPKSYGHDRARAEIYDAIGAFYGIQPKRIEI